MSIEYSDDPALSALKVGLDGTIVDRAIALGQVELPSHTEADHELVC